MSLVTSTNSIVYTNEPETDKALSSLPQHFKNDATELVKLLEAYYRFLNQKFGPSYEISKIIHNHDIDLTTDDRYLDAIEKLIGSYIPKSRAVDRKRLYKLIASYYTNRGSEESISSFFRLFFNEIISIFYPKEFLFTTSDDTRSAPSSRYRLNDNNRWQDFSYVIYTSLDKSEWGQEFTKYIHPAGLKFFATLAFELFANNDWKDISCLNIDWEEDPSLFQNNAYIAPNGFSYYYFDDASDPYSFGSLNPNLVEAIPDDNCWRSIDWQQALGQHTPTSQCPAFIAMMFVTRLFYDNSGFHYVRDGRPIISDQYGNVSPDFLKAFYIVLSYIIQHQNDGLYNFRSYWNDYEKVVDPSTLGTYADASLSDLIANPPNRGSGPQFNSLGAFVTINGVLTSGYNLDGGLNGSGAEFP